MNANPHPACYGTMFPDLTRTEVNTHLKGHVFTARFESAGMFIQGRSFEVDKAQWDKCTACEHYRTCYDLGLAKFLLGNAIGEAR